MTCANTSLPAYIRCSRDGFPRRVANLASAVQVGDKQNHEKVLSVLWLNSRPAENVGTLLTAHLKPEQFLFPSRVSASPHLSTRQYSRIIGSWVNSIGLDAAAYGTHSMRRTKATMIYRRTRNLRAVQLLLGHTKLESTVRYLGIEVDDALEIAEQTEAESRQ